ncbi:MAG: class I SAM-dependent methyltransferase [Clostridia bacterium]|nr:class I SAM-dependent methyltransferase [Clostridia bacterium]
MSYGSFAYVYDRLTENVDYKSYAAYIKRLFESYGKNINISSVLDVACGTGSLTEELSLLGYDMIGADASSDMLMVAQEKKFEKNLDILYLCQRAEELDLFGTVQGAVCTLDSINHITDEETVIEAFRKISLFMEKNGIFIFDLNTEYKHREVLGNNTFVYDLDDVYCVWQNEYDEDEKVTHIFLDIFSEEEGLYERFSEEFDERAYSHEKVLEWLRKSDFELVDFFEEFTTEKPKDNTERTVYIARKK